MTHWTSTATGAFSFARWYTVTDTGAFIIALTLSREPKRKNMEQENSEFTETTEVDIAQPEKKEEERVETPDDKEELSEVSL